MPCGRTHDLITNILGILVIFFTFVFNGFNIESGLIIIFFYFAGYMFNGDLDTNSRAYNRWWVFKMIWIPYQLLFSHRSIFTHGFIVGTLMRLIYVFIIPFIFFSGEIIDFFVNQTNFIIFALVGMEIGAMSHTLADKFL